MTRTELGIIKKQFGNTVREIRLNKRLTVRKLSHQCDLDNSKLSKIENGRINISLSTLVELARGLQVNPSELLKGEFDAIAPQ
jgi:transcriptional regulator with XRE-family HTH domain